MHKGLILGASSGIGEQLAFDAKSDERFAGIEWATPSIAECDVANPASISLYVRDNGPFRYMAYCPGVNELKWIRDVTKADLDYAYGVNRSEEHTSELQSLMRSSYAVF